MVNIETIVTGVALSAGVAGGALLALGRLGYTKSYNTRKVEEFLGGIFGKYTIELGLERGSVNFEDPLDEIDRKGIMVMPVVVNDKIYDLELEHKKTSRLVDLIPFFRLYEPVRLMAKL